MSAQARPLKSLPMPGSSHGNINPVLRFTRKLVFPKSAIAICALLFISPALAAYRYNPIIQALVERLNLGKRKNGDSMAAVMRKLLHLAFGVLKKRRKPFDPLYLQNMPVGG